MRTFFQIQPLSSLTQHQRHVGLLSSTYVLQSIIGHWLLVSYSAIVWKHLHSLCVSTHFYQVFASSSDSSNCDLGLCVSPCMLKVFWEWFEKKTSSTFSDRKQVSGDVTVTKVEFREWRQESGARYIDEKRALKVWVWPWGMVQFSVFVSIFITISQHTQPKVSKVRDYCVSVPPAVSITILLMNSSRMQITIITIFFF